MKSSEISKLKGGIPKKGCVLECWNFETRLANLRGRGSTTGHFPNVMKTMSLCIWIFSATRAKWSLRVTNRSAISDLELANLRNEQVAGDSSLKRRHVDQLIRPLPSSLCNLLLIRAPLTTADSFPIISSINLLLQTGVLHFNFAQLFAIGPANPSSEWTCFCRSLAAFSNKSDAPSFLIRYFQSSAPH